MGFLQIHILIEAQKKPIFGLRLIQDLESYGYRISPGTIYPILSKLDKENLVTKEVRLENGKNRNYYSITDEGMKVLLVAKEKAMFLLEELNDIKEVKNEN